MSVTIAASVPSMAWSQFNTDLTEYGSMGSELQITASPAFFSPCIGRSPDAYCRSSFPAVLYEPLFTLWSFECSILCKSPVF